MNIFGYSNLTRYWLDTLTRSKCIKLIDLFNIYLYAYEDYDVFNNQKNNYLEANKALYYYNYTYFYLHKIKNYNTATTCSGSLKKDKIQQNLIVITNFW